ncbi:dihydrofolate reductase family protein [Nocardioides sp. GXZ039]|uniref:dihydrofolate reductase family protein n=1 Tax=Nocardioides sp. GXZ039 TaxID=3136018 RepID=UPI0030F4B048
MGTIKAFESITLDGVMQAPGRADEDTRGGFAHGGWADGFADEVSMKFAGEGMSQKGAMLFGRRTYDDLLGFWSAMGEDNPFTAHLLATPKYVVSRSEEPLTFANSTLLTGEATETVGRLRSEDDTPLTILGSGELVRALHAAGLIDVITLMVHPIVLGSGTRLFDAGERADLHLTRSVQTTTGVVIAEYAVDRQGD